MTENDLRQLQAMGQAQRDAGATIEVGQFVTIKEIAEIGDREYDLIYAQLNGLYGKVERVWDYNPDMFIVDFGGTKGYFKAADLTLSSDTPAQPDALAAALAEVERLRGWLVKIDTMGSIGHPITSMTRAISEMKTYAAEALKGKAP